MEWTSIAVALITGGLSLLGVYISNRKSGELIAYRLQQLEEKVDKHNQFAEKVPVMEERLKVANNRIKDLEQTIERMREEKENE